MNKIIPKISNGNLRLLLSETFCVNPQLGIKVEVPTADQEQKNAKDLIFHIDFPDDSPLDKPGMNMNFEVKEGQVYIKLYKFQNVLPMGLTKPIGITVGTTELSILFWGQALVDQQDFTRKNLLFTLTIYAGQIKS